MNTSTTQPPAAVATRHIDDSEVHEAVERATSAACAVLDELFPGGDSRGICTNFAGLLERSLLQMLSGQVPQPGRTSTWLPELVLTDASFGDPRGRGEYFVVTRADGTSFVPPVDFAPADVPPVGSPDEIVAQFRAKHIDGQHLPKIKVLSWDGRNFTSLSNTEAVNPCTSFAAAVAEAMRWLRYEETTQATAQLRVRPINRAGDGYVFADETS